MVMESVARDPIQVDTITGVTVVDTLGAGQTMDETGVKLYNLTVTPAGDYEIQLFSGYARDALLMPHDFDTPEDYLAYIDEITALSDFTADVTVGPGDRIISLVTCTYVTDNARYVLHGKLVPLYREDTE